MVAILAGGTAHAHLTHEVGRGLILPAQLLDMRGLGAVAGMGAPDGACRGRRHNHSNAGAANVQLLGCGPGDLFNIPHYAELDHRTGRVNRHGIGRLGGLEARQQCIGGTARSIHDYGKTDVFRSLHDAFTHALPHDPSA